jgi:beta-glucosidase
MLGGESCPEVIVELVERGHVSERQIDASVRRILRDKFRLGLFDNPYVDPKVANEIVGNKRFQAAGALAQRKAIVLLKNNRAGNAPLLPLRGRPKLYVEKLAADGARRYGEVVSDLAAADLAIIRLDTPYQPRAGNFLEQMFHAGDLDFKDEEKTRILDMLRQKPAVVVIHLDRPAVIPEIAAQSGALLGEFGASDEAVLDVIFGRFSPGGKLPFELPSSMEAVRRQYPDLPYDSASPLFRFGAGLSYTA